MEIYKIKCKICNKEIEGTSKAQCKYNLMIHQIKCKKELKDKEQ